MTLVFMEYLVRREIKREVFYKLASENAMEIGQKISGLQEENWREVMQYEFALAMLGIDTQEEAKKCISDVKSDAQYMLSVVYVPKTSLGMILKIGGQ